MGDTITYLVYNLFTVVLQRNIWQNLCMECNFLKAIDKFTSSQQIMHLLEWM